MPRTKHHNKPLPKPQEHTAELPQSFTGIWIPREICLIPTLSWTDKTLLAQIYNLNKKGSSCFAGNKYLTLVLGVGARHIPRMIAELKAKGFIRDESSKRNTRSLKINFKIKDKGYDGNVIPDDAEGMTSRYKGMTSGCKGMTSASCPTTYGADVIRSSSIQKNKEKKREKHLVVCDSEILFVAEVITYLNSKTGANYSSTAKNTIELITTHRQKDKALTLRDFQDVIDIKIKQWLNDPERKRYLRPETLFGDKFESYLNEKRIGGRHGTDTYPRGDTFDNRNNPGFTGKKSE